MTQIPSMHSMSRVLASATSEVRVPRKEQTPVNPVNMRLGRTSQDQDQLAFFWREIVALLPIASTVFDAGHRVRRNVLVVERVGEQRLRQLEVVKIEPDDRSPSSIIAS